MNRRQALAGLTSLAVATAASRFHVVELALAQTSEEKNLSLARWGLLIDSEKCATDCDACVTACNDEHNLHGFDRPETDAQWIRKVNLTDNQTGRVSSLPMLCQHCENPPCVDVCPTGASFKRDDGIVLVDKHICIGCRYCVMACPYKARSFVHENLSQQKSYSPRGKGTVESCTLCVHRIDKDQSPACVDACNSEGYGAMLFGDLNDSDGELAKKLANEPSQQVREDLSLNTGVRYQNI